MSIKLSFFRRLLINVIYAIAFIIMVGIPAYLAITEIYSNIEFVEGNRISLNWAVAGVFIMLGFAILYIKYFRKWFHRKLIGLQVRDELGIMPVKGIFGIVSDRLLRTLEYVYPFTVTLLILYVSKYMFGQYEVFGNLFDMNMVLIYLSAAAFGVFLVGDFVKISMMKKQEIINKLNLQVKSNKLELKQLKKQTKRAMLALDLERQLAQLKETTVIPEDNEPGPLPDLPESP